MDCHGILGRQRRLLLFLVSGCLFTGCASFLHPGDAPVADGRKRLILAADHLGKGETGAAGRILEEIIAGPAETGVTDQALFQLALVNLKTGSREGTVKAQHLLQRLEKGYPHGPWTSLGQPVSEMLDTLNEQRRQMPGLKNQLQSLQKENKELHQTIDRLKSLDLELEKKNRR